METLKEQYNKSLAERATLIDQINDLAQNETVKKYFELTKRNDQLLYQQRELFKQIKGEEYSTCNHIWVNSSSEYCGCIKCGLDQRVLLLMKQYRNLDFLTLNEQMMYRIIKSHNYKNGLDTGVYCDLELAKAIYIKIKEVYPRIDDETARKYFEIALNNIRRTKVSDARKASRARRLSLRPDFNKWF